MSIFKVKFSSKRGIVSRNLSANNMCNAEKRIKNRYPSAHIYSITQEEISPSGGGGGGGFSCKDLDKKITHLKSMMNNYPMGSMQYNEYKIALDVLLQVYIKYECARRKPLRTKRRVIRKRRFFGFDGNLPNDLD